MDYTIKLLLALSLLAGMLLSPGGSAANAERCFSETGQCISGRFREYWEQNGGLAVFGYPITPARNELNSDTGQVYLTQWFERNRFELHPEQARPYDVLLGRLGNDRLLQQQRDWRDFAKAKPTVPHYFPETGHAVAEFFWDYWSSHGLEFDGRPGVSFNESLALFGMPLSEPLLETNSSGDTVFTQWFERARFEYHPNNPSPHQVLLGLLGNEVRANADPCSLVPLPLNARLHVDRCIKAGTELVFDIYGFQPGELVTYALYDPNGNLMPGTAATLKVDSRGELNGLRTSSDGMYAGLWHWTFRGVDSGHQAAVWFLIRE